MGISSATETFTDSAELFDQEKYQSTVRTYQEPDLERIEETFQRPLSERIVRPVTKNVYGEYRLDDVIVRCPSDAFREHQVQEWNTLKKEADDKSRTWAYLGIGGVGVGIGGALATASGYFFGPYIAAFGAGTATTSGVLAAMEHSSANKAENEINKWDTDPVMKVGQARNEAHNQGFPYIYANRLKLGEGPSKTALFHPLQVEYEYKKYFTAFCRKLLEQYNPALNFWMNQFRSCNPVSSAYMTYGLGHIPEHMKLVLEDYTRLESILNDIAATYEKLKDDVRKTARERVDTLIKTRNEQLQQFAKDRDAGIAAAEINRDRVLRDPQTSDTRRKEARATFDGIKVALQDLYNRSAAPINKKYEMKIKEIEKGRDGQINKLDDQKSSQLGNNYRAARELLERAKHAWNNKGYQPVNFQHYFPYQAAQPVWVEQQPAYYQPTVYPQQPAYPIQPQVPQYGNPQYGNPGYGNPQYGNPGYGYPGYGQFGYGHGAQIPAHQQYYYAPPKRP